MHKLACQYLHLEWELCHRDQDSCICVKVDYVSEKITKGKIERKQE